MLTAMKRKQDEPIPDVADDQRVIDAQAKLDRLYERRHEIEDAMNELLERRPAPRLQDEAEAMLDGRPAPTREEKPKWADLSHLSDVVNRAISIQEKAVAEAKSLAARDIRRELTPRRAKLVADMDNAVSKLIDAIEAHENFIDECERFEVIDPVARIGYPWASAALPGGTPRHQVERLRNWRKEYQATKFLAK